MSQIQMFTAESHSLVPLMEAFSANAINFLPHHKESTTAIVIDLRDLSLLKM